MYKQVKEYLANNNWKYHSPKGNDNVFLFSLETENTKYNCIIDVNDEEGKFMFYVVFPNKVPKRKRNLIANAITLLNYGLFLGNFEMDFDDGQIRYKAHMYYKGLEVSLEVIDFYISYSITFSELNYDLLLSAVFSEKPSQEVLNEIASAQQKLADSAS